MKLAVTERAALIVTAHAPVPLHPPPLQPAKLEPLAGAALSVTLEEAGKLVLHVAPQLMPAGLLLTVPVPVPLLVTVSVWFGAADVVNVRFAPVNVPLAVT